MAYIEVMRMARQVFLCACMFGVVVAGGAESRPLDNYQSIIDRNPFGLKDPPPPPKETNAPIKDVKKDEFYLTGISTLGAPKKPKKAYLISKDNSKKDYHEKYFNLAVGERQGDLMVKEIDEKERRVKIAYLGEESWLSMKDNSVPAPVGPPPAVAGAHAAGAVPLPGGVPPPPGAVPLPLPNAPGTGAPGAQPTTYPNPNRRIPRGAMTGAGNTYGAPVVGGRNTDLPTTPGTYQGPQNEAEMLKHLIEAQNPTTLPPGVPRPPVPTL